MLALNEENVVDSAGTSFRASCWMTGCAWSGLRRAPKTPLDSRGSVIVTLGSSGHAINYPVQPMNDQRQRDAPGVAVGRLGRTQIGVVRPTSVFGAATRCMISHFFIDRPIFATVLSIVIVIVGAVALTQLPIAQYPGRRAADGAGDGQLSRGQRHDRGRHRRHADRAGDQRRRAHALHVVAVHERRPDEPGRHVRAGHEPRHGPGAGAEPRGGRRGQAARGGQAASGVTTKKKSPSILLCVNLISPGRNRYDQLYLSNYATINVKDDLARIKGVGDVAFLGPRDYSMRDLARSRTSWPRAR